LERLAAGIASVIGPSKPGWSTFLPFAGAIELGLTCSYLEGIALSDMPDLWRIFAGLDVQRWGTDHPFLGLAARLYRRLSASSPFGRTERDPRASATFERYLLLVHDVLIDDAARKFRRLVFHGEQSYGAIELAALASPEGFASALVQDHVDTTSALGYVKGGVALLGYFSTLSLLRRVLAYRPDLADDILRHASWAHRIGAIRDRYDTWVQAMQRWPVTTPEHWEERDNWQRFRESVLNPLVHDVERLGLRPAESVEMLLREELTPQKLVKAGKEGEVVRPGKEEERRRTISTSDKPNARTRFRLDF
jgi:hypothetical protein